MSAYYATSGPATATEQPTLAPVLVAFAGPAPQSRLTVLFRYFLLMSFLVLGVLFSAGCGATAGAAHGNGVSATNATNATNQVQANTTPVTDAVNNYSANVQACKGQLACVTQLDRQVAATFNTFAGQLRATKMPSKATAANAALVASVSRAAAIYARLGAVTSATQYINTAKASGLTQALGQVNQDYANLGTALRS
jgi:hypothetical protein